jgi:hypothetical protein
MSLRCYDASRTREIRTAGDAGGGTAGRDGAAVGRGRRFDGRGLVGRGGWGGGRRGLRGLLGLLGVLVLGHRVEQEPRGGGESGGGRGSEAQADGGFIGGDRVTERGWIGGLDDIISIGGTRAER